MVVEDKNLALRITISPRLHEYLGWLSTNTLLGNSENDVARYLLTKELENMRQSDYSESPLSVRGD